MPPAPVSKRTFQVVALGTLPLPFFATWAAWPHLPHLGDDADLATATRVLVGALTLLGCGLLWAVALLPLRRRSALPPITQGLEGASLGALGAAHDKARLDLHADATAAAPAPRRRYHLRMAAAGALVALATGAVTAAMVTGPSGTVYLWFPVAAVVSAALALYHLVRGLVLPSG